MNKTFEKVSMSNLIDLGSTFRSRTPEETLAWVQPKLKSMGITRIANITGLDHIGIPVATCMRPNSRHLSVSQGKGITLDLAKASAVMESIEGYHIENAPPPVLQGSYADLSKAYDIISPEQFSRTSFTPGDLLQESLGWALAECLSAGQVINSPRSHQKGGVYIPHALTCIDTTRHMPDYRYLKSSTNGLASGNTLDEAICHGLYEVVERDALFLWQQLSNETRLATQLDLTVIDNAVNAELIAMLQAANIDVKVWEITSDIALPAYHCAIFDSNAMRGLSLFTGTGAHLSKDIAFSRAVTEAAQSRLTLITGNRDDIFPDYYERLSKKAKQAAPVVKNGVRDYKSCCTPALGQTLAEHKAATLRLLEQQSYAEVLFVDHTKPDIDVPVVQVFVTGLGFNGVRM